MFNDRRKTRPSIFYKPQIEDESHSILSRRTTLFSASIVTFDEEILNRNIILSSCNQVNEPPIRLFELNIDNDKLVDYDYKIENAQKWLMLPGKDGVYHKFPTQSLLPKVQLTRVVPKKTLPRDVEVDRRRRQYAKIDLQTELDKAGCFNEELMPTEQQYLMLSENSFKHFLPLSFFDDSNYDIHSPSAWIKLGIIEDGTAYPLPAKAFLPVNRSLVEHRWQLAAIKSYDAKTEKWTAMALADECIYEIPKIQFVLFAENPYNYVERLKFAMEQRNYAENILMLETIVDCVMLQNLVEDQRRPNALVDRLMSNVKTDPEFYQQLQNEIYVLFEHLMIYYEFEKFIKYLPKEFPKFTPEMIKLSLPKAFPSILSECDRRELKSLKINLKARKKSVLTTTLYYTKMGIEAMKNVVIECQYIETLTLFVYTFAKPLPLPDFILSQQQNSTNVANYLSNFWPSKIASGVIIVLRALGKGWLDISLDKWTVYNMCKISRFINQVKLRMQESIQVLLEKSMINFMNILIEPCLQFHLLNENYKWTSDYIESEFPSNKPVFSLILSISDERQAVYSIDPEEFAPGLREVFKKSLDKVKSIRCIDADTMTHLRFAPNLCILTVELIENLYIKSDADLQFYYTKAILPLRSYADKYNYFVDFYLLNVSQYMQKYRAEKKSSMEVKQDIITHKRLKEETREILPASIVIGPFSINIDLMKQFLIKKRIDVIRRIFDYYVDRMYDTNEHLLERCAQTYNKIHERPQSIEHLYEIRDFAATIPEVVEQLRADIQVMWLEYDMLDSFFYNLPDHQFAMKWEAYAWPKNILDRLSTLRDEQRVDIEDFRRQHMIECTAFEERLESLNDEIQAFSLQFNPERVQETSVEIKKTYRIISELEKTGETLKFRQELFELEPFSLEFLESIMDSFLPYKNLWYACLDLVKLEEATIGNPIVNLEMEDIWEATETIRENLYDSVKVFNEKPEIQDVAHYYLDVMNKFIPKYNAIKDLRNENWIFIHWQELANRTGLDIKFSNSMNFQYCIRKGILDYLDLVHEISVKATNEADAIREAFIEEERRKKEEEEAILLRKALRNCRTDIM